MVYNRFSFLSLPNGEAQKIVKKNFYKYPNIKFIDLSADFRLDNVKNYKNWYHKIHHCPELNKQAIYSISEFVKRKIKDFRIISNLSCYPTSIQLAITPILKKNLIETKNIIMTQNLVFQVQEKILVKNSNKKIYSSLLLLIQLLNTDIWLN